MKLPNNEIGISDIKNFRDCPRRFLFGMRRHTEGAEPPEDVHPDTMYGTVFHETVTLIEAEGLDDEEAIQRAFNEFASYLDPEDLDKLKLDLETYHERDEPVGYRTVANEKEVRVPLFNHPCPDCGGKGKRPSYSEGEVSTRDLRECPDCGGKGTVTIYFRAKIDRLYQRLDAEGVFLHRDYKSSKWEKSEEEVHSDEQMWAYNWLIHEFWAECEDLEQHYDQLRYGIERTSKSPSQRDTIKEWLIRQVTAILEAPEVHPGKLNQWCPWCPIKVDCPTVHRLGDFAKARIAALAPEGLEDFDPDPEAIDPYVEPLEEMQTAVKTLEAYIESVKSVVKELPNDERKRVGFRLRPKKKSHFPAEVMPHIRETLGEETFDSSVKLSQSAIKKALPGEENKEERDRLLGLLKVEQTNPTLVKDS